MNDNFKTINSETKINEGECPSCKHQGVIIGTSLGEEVYKCNQCELCYLKKSIRPKSNNDNNWYGDLKDAPQDWINLFVNDMKKAYLHQISILSKLATEKTIIDVGCGLGIFLSLAKNQGWNIYGLEESEHAKYFAQKNFDIEYSKSLSELPSNFFDVVRISHVLEHIPEPKEFLKELHRILKPNGILLIIVPNREPLCASLVNKWRSIFSEKPKLAGAIYPDMHVLGFSTKSLLRLVNYCDFTALELFTISMGDYRYFPMFYDGLLKINKISNISLRSMITYYFPMWIDNLGNKFNKGQWIVGYFRKE